MYFRWHRSAEMHSVLLAAFAAWFLSASGQKAPLCKRRNTAGLSLLAHKGHMQKSPEVPDQSSEDIWVPSYSDYNWCHCGGIGDNFCDLLQTGSERSDTGTTEKSLIHSSWSYNRTAQCNVKFCGEMYPSSTYTCLNIPGNCLGLTGNCLYTTPNPRNTSDVCGHRLCWCATVPPGQCIPEKFPGYVIVQNGAYNLTTGKRPHPVGNGSTREYPPDLRVWETVGGAGNHACRGDNSSDNNPMHYEVHTTIKSLWGCKNFCERTDYCKGIEFSAGRCEIWKRSRGIYYVKEIPKEKGEFTCLRFGWPTKKLVPAGPSGTSHPCRGRSSTDNHPKHYTVTWWIAAPHLDSWCFWGLIWFDGSFHITTKN